MEVFYVVLLVLVAGAVPSHGRTESEGTVFNKTQLHESTSNVTVSSSKVGDSLSFLALQWPQSFCMDLYANHHQQCSRSAPSRFTVHGFWPQYDLWNGVDCHGSEPLEYNNLRRRRLVRDLIKYWPSLGRVGNKIFWQNEYNKHGSCIFRNQVTYFSNTLTLAKNFRSLIGSLTATGVGPRINYDLPNQHQDVKAAVLRATKFLPSLKCVFVGNKLLLLEIRFCVGSRGLKSCDQYVANCGRLTDSVYIIRPPRRP